MFGRSENVFRGGGLLAAAGSGPGLV